LFFVPSYLHKASVQTYFNGNIRDYKSVRTRRILCFFFPYLHGKWTYYNHEPANCQAEIGDFYHKNGWKCPFCAVQQPQQKHTNAHRPRRGWLSRRETHQCPPPPGPAQTKFAWVEPGRGGRALHDGGWGNHE